MGTHLEVSMSFLSAGCKMAHYKSDLFSLEGVK